MATLYGPTTLRELQSRVVGRERELELVVAALMAGRHLLLEGPPGTGKSTILRAVTNATDQTFVPVDGNAELTPARLIGHFDPSQVLATGYAEDIWIDGPLTSSVRDGGLLYIEELNRIPEETLNVLVSVMSEGELTVPRLGTITAHPDFRLVAAMNPFDAVGTARVAGAIYDRVCRISMTYQPRADEIDIALAATDVERDSLLARRAPLLIDLVRATRDHPEVEIGSSVRGAIDALVLVDQLATLRSASPEDHVVGLDAALLALSGRLRLDPSSRRTSEEIITELWEELTAALDDEANRPGTDDAGDQMGGGSGKGHSHPVVAPTTTGS